MTAALILLSALLLDAIFGEPDAIWKRFPHPAVLIGRLIGFGDDRWNTGKGKRLKGVLFIIGLIGLAWMAALFISWIPDFGLLEITLGAILIAHRSLVDHVTAVSEGLQNSLAQGREKVAMIVGRDTNQMDESAISRAAIESGAENFSDGVIAPAFWFLIGGLPGILIYKTVNTADSMIGYLNERYAEFGWAAARLDDLLNWIPARISGALLCAVSRQPDSWKIMSADAGHHRSPNAGWPEAAMAGALNLALSGPRTYEGQRTKDPFVNAAGRRDLTRSDISDAVKVLWKAWTLFVALIAVIGLIFTFL